MAGVYTAPAEIASESRQHDKTLTKATAADQSSRWSAARPRHTRPSRSCVTKERYRTGSRAQFLQNFPAKFYAHCALW